MRNASALDLDPVEVIAGEKVALCDGLLPDIAELTLG